MKLLPWLVCKYSQSLDLKEPFEELRLLEILRKEPFEGVSFPWNFQKDGQDSSLIVAAAIVWYSQWKVW